MLQFPAMPFSPSDLPWWGWLIASGATLFVAALFGGVSSASFKHKGSSFMATVGCFGVMAAAAFGLIGALTGAVGVILFVKWVWTG